MSRLIYKASPNALADLQARQRALHVRDLKPAEQSAAAPKALGEGLPIVVAKPATVDASSAAPAPAARKVEPQPPKVNVAPPEALAPAPVPVVLASAPVAKVKASQRVEGLPVFRGRPASVHAQGALDLFDVEGSAQFTDPVLRDVFEQLEHWAQLKSASAAQWPEAEWNERPVLPDWPERQSPASERVKHLAQAINRIQHVHQVWRDNGDRVHRSHADALERAVIGFVLRLLPDPKDVVGAAADEQSEAQQQAWLAHMFGASKVDGIGLGLSGSTEVEPVVAGDADRPSSDADDARVLRALLAEERERLSQSEHRSGEYRAQAAGLTARVNALRAELDHVHGQLNTMDRLRAVVASARTEVARSAGVHDQVVKLIERSKRYQERTIEAMDLEYRKLLAPAFPTLKDLALAGWDSIGLVPYVTKAVLLGVAAYFDSRDMVHLIIDPSSVMAQAASPEKLEPAT